MKIINQRDFWAGALFLAFGAYFAGEGSQYNFGTPGRMGPGYFPTLLGGVLIVLGILVTASSMSRKAASEKVEQFQFATLLFILGPVVLFGLSLLLLVVIASFASHEFTLSGALINAAFLIALCVAIFVYALDLRFQLWPAMFGF
jgi:hypothetical protein